jgi:hypothetical protein
MRIPQTRKIYKNNRGMPEMMMFRSNKDIMGKFHNTHPKKNRPVSLLPLAITLFIIGPPD